MDVEGEVEKLKAEIKRLGARKDGGKGNFQVKYGVLFKDETVANTFEALLGTLKAAKKRKVITYAGELLLQGVHDNVDIELLVE